MTCRQAIVDALVLRLQCITQADGYNSDVGLNVFVWPPENMALPSGACIMVADTDDTITPQGAGQIEHSLRIDVEGQVSGDQDTIEGVYDLLGDIIVAVMGSTDRTMGGVCDSIQPLNGGTISLEQRAEDVAGAVAIQFEVKFRTQRGDWSTKI